MAQKGTSHLSQLDRLTRVEGQIRGVIKMIGEKRYCIDILTQLKAVSSAIKATEREIMIQHINGCVSRALDDGKDSEKEKYLREIVDLLKAGGR